MEIRIIDGKRCTDRVGAAEHLDRSQQTINLWASPKKRAETGWPEPVAKQDRKDWYALADLDAFRDEHLEPTQESGLPRVHHIAYADDPETLIDDAEFRDLIQVSPGTWSFYIARSKTAWKAGRDGYLPRPDYATTVRGGERRQWRQHRAADWINSRLGSATSPGRPPAAD